MLFIPNQPNFNKAYGKKLYSLVHADSQLRSPLREMNCGDKRGRRTPLAVATRVACGSLRQAKKWLPGEP